MIAVALMLGTCVIGGGMRVLSLEHNPLAEAAPGRSVVVAEVQLRNLRVSQQWGMAIVNATCSRVTVAGQSYRVRQPVVVLVPSSTASDWLAYPIGAVVRVTARLGTGEPGEPVAATLSVLGRAEVIRPPPTWQRVIEAMRAGLVQAMSHSPDEQAALLPGLVVGDVSAMSASLTAQFKATGLTHLTAVSGANLAIMLSFLSVLARWCGVRGRWLNVISVVGVAVFIVLCHSEASVLRAAAMGIVALAALGRSKSSASGLRSLSLAVMGLCWYDPWMSHSLAFQLSVLASGGIILWGRHWSEALATWLPRPLAEAMAIPLAAQLATQPVICYLSGAISLAGLAANAAAGPWVAPATVLGLIAALISVLSPTIAIGFAYVGGWCAQPILTVSKWLASLPGAWHPWPVTPLALGCVVAACLVVAWVMPQVLSRAIVVFAVTIAMVALLMVAPFQPGWPGKDWVVAACDVGQGDAVAVRSGPNQAVVFDVGPESVAAASCLRQLGVRRIPLLVLTHFHSDHAGGFQQVIDAIEVDTILVPSGGGNAEEVYALAAQRGITIKVGAPGQGVQIGEVMIMVVAAWRAPPTGASGEDSSQENDESLIVKVTTATLSLLITGDIEVAGQQAALAAARAELAVDIIKVPHHGSARQDPDFLKATGARIALVSVGERNVYGHPADKCLRLLGEAGMTIVRTDQHGSIAIARDQTWSIKTQR
jgi:competence protein ComEC